MLGLKLTEMGFRHEFCDIGHRSLTDGGKSIDVSAINNFPPLTEKECLDAVKSMESGKSPGTDGLPAKFYKVFWKDVSPFLISSFNKSYQKGKLAIAIT